MPGQITTGAHAQTQLAAVDLRGAHASGFHLAMAQQGVLVDRPAECTGSGTDGGGQAPHIARRIGGKLIRDVDAGHGQGSLRID